MLASRTSLTLLVAVTLLPILLAAAMFGVVLVDRDRSNRERSFLDAAQALSRVVDAQLSEQLALATTLAASPTLNAPDFGAFYELGRRVIAGHPRKDFNLLLTDPEGTTQLLNLRRPLDAPPLPVLEGDSIRRSVREGKPVIGPVVAAAPLNPEPVLTVRMPVLRDGPPRLVLTVGLSTSRFADLARQVSMETGYIVAIFDAYGTTIIRTDGDYAGQPLNPAVKVPEDGIFYGPGRDGLNYVRALVRSGTTGWRVGVGIPESAFEAPLRANAWMVAAVGLVAALGSSGLALWVGRSIARRARSEQQDVMRRLEAALHAAQRADAAKSQFLAASSHDLRQPFQAMQLYYHVADNDFGGDRGRHALSALGHAMAACQDLLNALLDVSILDSGIVRVNVAVQDLGTILREMGDEHRDLARDRGLELRLRTIETEILTDPVLLKRVIRNLLVNALRYTNSGGVILGARRRGANVLIQVWDTGAGIPADRLDDIFEDFYQIDNPARDRTRGLGLGLGIVRRSARLLGHVVSVKSQPGRGSVFSVSVPLARPDATRTGAMPERLKKERWRLNMNSP